MESLQSLKLTWSWLFVKLKSGYSYAESNVIPIECRHVDRNCHVLGFGGVGLNSASSRDAILIRVVGCYKSVSTSVREVVRSTQLTFSNINIWYNIHAIWNSLCSTTKCLLVDLRTKGDEAWDFEDAFSHLIERTSFGNLHLPGGKWGQILQPWCPKAW